MTITSISCICNFILFHPGRWRHPPVWQWDAIQIASKVGCVLQAKSLTSTPELSRLWQTAEGTSESQLDDACVCVCVKAFVAIAVGCKLLLLWLIKIRKWKYIQEFWNVNCNRKLLHNSPVVFQTWNEFSINLSNFLPSAYDPEMATLFLWMHLRPPPPRGMASPKISARDKLEGLVVFHKVIV